MMGRYCNDCLISTASQPGVHSGATALTATWQSTTGSDDPLAGQALREIHSSRLATPTGYEEMGSKRLWKIPLG